MTRINVVPPKELTDQHLMAEYRELPMIMASLRRSLASPNGLPEIPKHYTLNTGHVTFFYDKGKYLYHRYLKIIDNLKDRGYNLDPDRKADFSVFKENGLYNDWSPNADALRINRQRLAERINAKPEWYKWYGKPL